MGEAGSDFRISPAGRPAGRRSTRTGPTTDASRAATPAPTRSRLAGTQLPTSTLVQPPGRRSTRMREGSARSDGDRLTYHRHGRGVGARLRVAGSGQLA